MALQEHRQLIMRSNRFLGAMLLEKKLVSVEQLETANEKMLENIQKDDLRRASILHVLVFDLQALNEDLYLEAVVEQHALGLIDLHGCQFRKITELTFDLSACWATWTAPFDVVDDFCLMATAFYPSQPAVKFWTERFPGRNLLWYAASMRSLQTAFDRLEQIKAEPAKTTQAHTATRLTKSPFSPAAAVGPARASKPPIPLATTKSPTPSPPAVTAKK